VASNIGCHVKWKDAGSSVKHLFKHYISKDPGMLFHAKILTALPIGKPNEPPLWIYIGSANFSESAWGKWEIDKSSTDAKENSMMRLKAANYECGVLVKGDYIAAMLGDGDWDEVVRVIYYWV
jgi:tyrosyl-DNA phosphodiesterase-1